MTNRDPEALRALGETHASDWDLLKRATEGELTEEEQAKLSRRSKEWAEYVELAQPRSPDDLLALLSRSSEQSGPAPPPPARVRSSRRMGWTRGPTMGRWAGLAAAAAVIGLAVWPRKSDLPVYHAEVGPFAEKVLELPSLANPPAVVRGPTTIVLVPNRSTPVDVGARVFADSGEGSPREITVETERSEQGALRVELSDLRELAGVSEVRLLVAPRSDLSQLNPETCRTACQVVGLKITTPRNE